MLKQKVLPSSPVSSTCCDIIDWGVEKNTTLLEVLVNRPFCQSVFTLNVSAQHCHIQAESILKGAAELQ